MTSIEQKQFAKNYFGEAISTIPSVEELDKTMPHFRRAFIKFVKTLPEGAKVLDIGCGKGKFAAILLAYRPDVDLYGMDITDVGSMLPQNITFKVGSAESLQELYPEDAFDAVICFHVIEHLLYPIAFMEGVQYILKKGGSMYLETPNWSRGAFPFLDTYFWNDYTHIRIFTKKTLERLFSDYQFRVTALKSVCSATLFTPRDFSTLKGITTGKSGAVTRRTRSNILAVPFVLAKKLFFRIIALTVQDVLVAVVTNEKHG